jgi:hypothetical protein
MNPSKKATSMIVVLLVLAAPHLIKQGFGRGEGGFTTVDE